jgi:DNA-binding protein HU-beta
VVSVGDRVRFESTTIGHVPRDGVVTGVDGKLLHIEWSTGGESSLVPGAGSITIVGKVSDKPARGRTTTKRTPARKAAKKSAPATKRTPARKAAKKAAKKSAPATKRTPARKAAKKAVKKSAPARKRVAKRTAKR